MIAIVLCLALGVGVLVVLADDGYRYLFGQLMKMIAGFAGVAVCLAILAVLFVNLHHF